MTHDNTTASKRAGGATEIFADAARLRKIIFLTGALDSALSLLGADPFSAQALEYVLAMNEGAWREAAKHANVNLPSQTTRDAIVDLYRRRQEIRECLSRVVKSAGGAR
jgi:hypothetical protein